ncbi:UDP-Glycosyltransferase/glycogen phosphorylase [Westerdykella ornata]|uniref:UDP-Glycosyltransferase/glycogen phosphorylase n=1 Tax=Westerdykella ornata TaxID=318751 RepID=A0A6A6JTA8_WESOR|nr:UDP-Glycosyltransferase/glycogen phosphorylase [Westerdykella ornata]KAF2279850.1 UDP-Glycosyltransferase/glycogen phosphorylase [Westerdykella ornata]
MMFKLAFAIFAVTLLTLPAQATNAFERLHDALHPKRTAADPSQTPLIFASVPHISHLEKVAAVALELASIGYPIKFLTGRAFENLISNLHPNIEFAPFLGLDGLMTEEDMKTLMSLPPKEKELFATKKAFVDGMKDHHNSIQREAAAFRQKHGDTKPLVILFDMSLTGHYPVLLGAPGIRPDASIAISTAALVLDSNDTFPFKVGKVPDTSENARDVHWAACQEYFETPFYKELHKHWEAKLRELGATKEPFPGVYDAMNTVSDYLATQGIPEFEFPRSDIRTDIRYFGALKNLKKTGGEAAELPTWWDDIRKAKAEGKKIVAVSQGTVEVNPQELILPTISALKDREDVLVIATLVAFEPSEVLGEEVPENARVAKFVPHDMLLPLVSREIVMIGSDD